MQQAGYKLHFGRVSGGTEVVRHYGDRGVATVESMLLHYFGTQVPRAPFNAIARRILDLAVGERCDDA